MEIPEELRHPKKPTWLGKAASKKWDDLVPLLERMQILTIADADIIAAYCQSWQRWREADADLEKNGFTLPSASGSPKANPAISVRREMMIRIQALGDRLGLNPEARKSLNVAAIFKRTSAAARPTRKDPEPAAPTPAASPSSLGGEDFFKRKSS